jgi:membrane protease subunit HflC
MKKTIFAIIIALILVIGLSGSLYTVREDQYACTFRFSEIVNTVNTPGLHFRIPFIDSV